MALTRTQEMTQPVNVMFQQRLLRVARQRCPYFKGTMPGTIRSHEGTFSLTWRRIGTLEPTTTALGELSSGNLSLPTRNAIQSSVTDVSATIQKYGDFVLLTEEADLINFNGQTDGIVLSLAIQSGRSLNRLQRNNGEDNATLIRPAGATTDGDTADPITFNMMEQATNTLENNSALMFTDLTTGADASGTAPILPAFWGLCHTHVKPDIRKLSGFQGAETYAGQASLAEGEFGTVGDTRWISTPEASVDEDLGGAAGSLRSTTGTKADLYTSLLFGRDATGSVSLDVSLIQETYMAGDDVPGIMIINKAKGSSGVADALDEVASLGWKSWHAAAVLNADWIRGLRHGASLLQ